ncbi:hypothetical protein BpHYR1_027922 [Brachionus plicatilis]|uniref:Uncharacterized protein n=1 Tax=Brachionus plicatilis TaxID=10195 RepID=A0A3M7T8C6_BRAPC|nr:hypothetical protein BpHYR1_027922 [Brachionus plicatilis]
MNSAGSNTGFKIISEYKDNYMLSKERYKSDTNERNFVEKLGQKYSTSLASSDLSGHQQNITSIIYNEKHAVLKPTYDSDYRTNYSTPDKKDYRKKRTQTLYPNYVGSSVGKQTISEYRKEF